MSIVLTGKARSYPLMSQDIHLEERHRMKAEHV
jgi:hypothetical protein